MKKAYLHIIIILSFIFNGTAQENPSKLKFTENRGQFEPFINYKLSINEGDIYLENNKITYNLFSRDLISDIHHGKKSNTTTINGHAYSVHFENANPKPLFFTEEESSNYRNYFIGKDESKWATNVHDFGTVVYKNIYDGIDVKYYGHYGQVKYDFIVEPGANPNKILLSYEGIDKMKIKNGHLFMETNFGTLVENSPYAYQLVEGKQKKIECEYYLKNNQLSFIFNEDYDESLELVIDPVLSFATFTGSEPNNFGCTATYDQSGNMYVGGTVFGFGYPTTIGAFQTTYSGGNIDMGITKLSSNGSNLLYSTYIGGSDNEIPHSLVVNSNNELCIMGTSGSINYPTTIGVLDESFNGGDTLYLGNGYGFHYLNGCDIVVTKLSGTGNALLASTFVGGTSNDGINRGSELHYNYGDAFRGEIIVDANDNIYIASTTSSTDFPLVNASQTTHGGGNLDAVIFKSTSNLTSLTWSTYLGGANYDCAYSVQLDSGGDIFVTGGTKSTNFITTTGVLHETYQGGISDGFITHYTSTTNSLINSTYIGTADYDQCLFIQADINDDIFVVGQSNGNYPITPGTYNNSNSGQFIQKLPNDLSSSLVSTTIGTSSGEVDISISAFLVDNCNRIYISGWGGPLNGRVFLGALATQSTTIGLPITSPTFQNSTDGADFYLAVLNENAEDLIYATFFGGGISEEHVDGGTSRFDKNGTVYQSVCAGCGGNSDFPTNSGAWSNTNESNCNLGAIKFDLAKIKPTISIILPYVCYPSPLPFANNSSGGNAYHWDFGDGNTSTDFEPIHNYSDTGNYNIELIVMDTTGCLSPDTSVVNIDVFIIDNALIVPIDTICLGDSIQLDATGGVSYRWTPDIYLSDPNIANPIAYPPITTNYQVVTVDSCGSDTAIITIHVHEQNIGTIPDTAICISNSVILEAFGGVDYSWLPTIDMTNSSSQTPVVTPNSTTTYYVNITTENGCVFLDSITIEVDINTPIPSLPIDTLICDSDTIAINATGGRSIIWTPASIVSDSTNYNIFAFPEESTMLIAQFTNACGIVKDSVLIAISDFFPKIVNDTIICPGDTASLWAADADFYKWIPSLYLSNSDSSNVLSTPSEQITYYAICTNLIGCSQTLNVTVSLYPIPSVYAGIDQNVNYGVPIKLKGITPEYTYYWESLDSLSCINCLTPTLYPYQSSEQILFAVDTNGCLNSDTVNLFVNSSIYIPNTFSPNGDGINDYFATLGEEITDFNIQIFDRWGAIIFVSSDINKHWDGTYRGKLVQQDAYIWKVKYSDYDRKGKQLIGHVSVLK